MTLDNPSYRTWRQLCARFQLILRETIAQRPRRHEFVDTPDGPELAWVLHERHRMHTEINKARAEAGLPAVAVEMVQRAETSTVGHVDYLNKFALYCADIVLDQHPWVRSAS